MACLCISSLRREGIELPIIIMTDENMRGRKELEIISELNVIVFYVNCTIRQWCYEIIFRHFPEIETLINIDCDQFLHNYRLDFESLADPEYDFQLFEKNNWEMESALDVFKSREFMFFNGSGDLGSLFNINLSEYKKWCENRRWVWGNFIIVNRRILGTQFWKTAKRMGFIYPDDEGAYMIAFFLNDDIKWRYLNNLVNQFIGALTVIENFQNVSTLIHYPGPIWKKESETIFSKLWRLHFENKNN